MSGWRGQSELPPEFSLGQPKLGSVGPQPIRNPGLNDPNTSNTLPVRNRAASSLARRRLRGQPIPDNSPRASPTHRQFAEDDDLYSSAGSKSALAPTFPSTDSAKVLMQHDQPAASTSFSASAGIASSLENDDSPFLPPDNFAQVLPGVYRSAFPSQKHMNFLRRRVGIRSILYLCPEEYMPANLKFMQVHGMQLLQHGVKGNKEPKSLMSIQDIHNAVKDVMDVRNQPVLIHCNKGKHRTGCVVGCVRLQAGWSVTATCREYRQFAAPKARIADELFIDIFSRRFPYVSLDEQYSPSWRLRRPPQALSITIQQISTQGETKNEKLNAGDRAAATAVQGEAVASTEGGSSSAAADTSGSANQHPYVSRRRSSASDSLEMQAVAGAMRSNFSLQEKTKTTTNLEDGQQWNP